VATQREGIACEQQYQWRLNPYTGTDSRSGRDLPLTIYSKMEIAKGKDSVPWPRADEWGPTMTINFVLLQSPLLVPLDPETIIVSREHQFIRGLSSIIV